MMKFTHFLLVVIAWSDKAFSSTIPMKDLQDLQHENFGEVPTLDHYDLASPPDGPASPSDVGFFDEVNDMPPSDVLGAMLSHPSSPDKLASTDGIVAGDDYMDPLYVLEAMTAHPYSPDDLTLALDIITPLDVRVAMTSPPCSSGDAPADALVLPPESFTRYNPPVETTTVLQVIQSYMNDEDGVHEFGEYKKRGSLHNSVGKPEEQTNEDSGATTTPALRGIKRHIPDEFNKENFPDIVEPEGGGSVGTKRQNLTKTQTATLEKWYQYYITDKGDNPESKVLPKLYYTDAAKESGVVYARARKWFDNRQQRDRKRSRKLNTKNGNVDA